MLNKKLNPRRFATKDFPLRQSHLSKLCGSFACSRSFFLDVKERNEGVPLKQFRYPKTVRGSIIHHCIEWGHQNISQLNKLPFVYLSEWRKEQTTLVNPQINWSYDDRNEIIIDGFKMLAGYFKDKRNLEAEVVAQELTFSVIMNGKYYCTGTIDQIRKTKDGLELVDFKSGEIPHQEELDWSYQLGLYAYAMLYGEFWSNKNPDLKIMFNEFPKKLGLVKLPDYISYIKPMPKIISYNSEGEYYGQPVGSKIYPLTSKNEVGHPLLKAGEPKGCVFYWSNYDLDFLPQFEKSLSNAISSVRMNRYWWANSSMVCSRCAYRGEVCRDIINESGSKLANLNIKPIRRRKNYDNDESSRCLETNGYR